MKSSRRRLFGTLICIVCALCIWNLLQLQPTVRYTPNHATGPHHISSSNPKDMNIRSSYTAVSHLKVVKSSIGKKLDDNSVTRFLAAEHSERLQRQSHDLVSLGSQHVMKLFDAFSGATTDDGHKVENCGYFAHRRHDALRKWDYSHRVKRKGELSTMHMYRKIKTLAGHGAFFEFGAVMPPVINQWPVQLSSDFDLTEPFGSWNTKFVPVRDVPPQLAEFAAAFEVVHLEGVDEAGSLHNASDASGGGIDPSSHSADHSTKHLTKRLTKSERQIIVKWLQHFHPPQRLERQPPAFVAMFRGAVVAHGHVVTCDGIVLTAGGCLWDFHLPQITQLSDLHREVAAVALCDEWCKGYYHFTHEHLPRVAVVHRLLLERRQVKLALSHAPNRFQRQFLTDVLGIPADQIIHGKAVLGDTVLYPTPMRCGNTFTTMLYLIRRIVYDRLQLSEEPTTISSVVETKDLDTAANSGSSGSSTAVSSGDNSHNRSVVVPHGSHGSTVKYHLLFAERKHLSRMPSNYYDLKQKLILEFGNAFRFSTTTGDSDAKSQIRLFHSSDVVVGPHGANIANMMWMRHGTHVVEIASRRKGNMCYYATASRINVTHHLVLHDRGKDAKFVLDYAYLHSHVSHALKMLRRTASRN